MIENLVRNVRIASLRVQLRNVRIASLRVQLWWLRQEMNMAAEPPKRRRRVVAPPAPKTEIVNQDAKEGKLEEGIAMPNDVLAYFVGSPLLAKRRVHFSSQELIQIIAEGLLRRGVPGGTLAGTRWLWVGKNGVPELFLIMPGIEA